MLVAHLSGFSEVEETEVKGASTTFLVFLYLLLSLLLFNLEVVHVLRSSLASFTYWMRSSYVEAYPGSENGVIPVTTVTFSSSLSPSPPSSTATPSPSFLSISSSMPSDGSPLLLSTYPSSSIRPRLTTSTSVSSLHSGTQSLSTFPPSFPASSSPSACCPTSEPR